MDVRMIRLFRPPRQPMPLYAHTVGYNKQNPMKRPDGFSTHQLLFSKSGRGQVHLDGRPTFELGPSQYVFLPAELPHEYFPLDNEPWVVGYVSFSGTRMDLLMSHFGVEPCQAAACTDMEAVWSMLDELWELADANEEGAEWEGARLIYGLLLDLVKMKQVSPSIQEPLPLTEEANPACDVIRLTEQYLNEHYNKNISLTNVAQSFGYTHQYLNRLFRQTYGLSMLQYVQKMRLGRAIELMRTESSIPVKEIALHIGMETNYFIRMFRKSTGKTPDQYRKEMLKSQ
ncbi:AraC family transcriptional regulator [Paenibacillus chibensis]|uniref:AraC family transcriptional regulator n=1 Tax=Paenibacillus chibensis TaxID=59846 RepID=A0ABU6PQI0_9BACL|nr:AraC family transcriptional regulator [Paenibacillus chibensis]